MAHILYILSRSATKDKIIGKSDHFLWGDAMTDCQQTIQIRHQAIKLFESGDYNVTQICRILGRSRTWFYKWIGRFRMLGKDGLVNQTRRLCPANRTTLDMEGEVLAAVEQFPGYGPQRIAYLLQRINIPIGKTAVYGVLKRYRLNRRRRKPSPWEKNRLEWIRILHGEIVPQKVVAFTENCPTWTPTDNAPRSGISRRMIPAKWSASICSMSAASKGSVESIR